MCKIFENLGFDLGQLSLHGCRGACRPEQVDIYKKLIFLHSHLTKIHIEIKILFTQYI